MDGISSFYRIDPIKDDSDSPQRRYRCYRRAWQTTTGRLSFMPTFSTTYMHSIKSIDCKLYYRAMNYLRNMATVEEKIAQLCFLRAESTYDVQQQYAIEQVILGWQVGGIVFDQGEFRRQIYLTERFQSISRTPLLIGNEFVHVLALYDRHLSKNSLNSIGFVHSLGKICTGLNRSLGVQIQFDSGVMLSDELARAFRNGIREAKGLVARKIPNRILKLQNTCQGIRYVSELQYYVQKQQKNTINVKSINICDLSSVSINEETLLTLLKNNYDGFLGDACAIKQVVMLLSTAIMKGHLSELTLDSHATKILYFKDRSKLLG